MIDPMPGATGPGAAEAIADAITPDLLMNTALATELHFAAEDMLARMHGPNGQHAGLDEAACALRALLHAPTEGPVAPEALRLSDDLAVRVPQLVAFVLRCAALVTEVAQTSDGIVGHTDRIERAVEDMRRVIAAS